MTSFRNSLLGDLHQSSYYGVGNRPIYTYGSVQSYVRLRHRLKLISFLIVPENTLPFPLLMRRNAARIFGLKLYFYQSPIIKLASELLQTNKLTSDSWNKINKPSIIRCSATKSPLSLQTNTHSSHFSANTHTKIGSSIQTSAASSLPNNNGCKGKNVLTPADSCTDSSNISRVSLTQKKAGTTPLAIAGRENQKYGHSNEIESSCSSLIPSSDSIDPIDECDLLRIIASIDTIPISNSKSKFDINPELELHSVNQIKQCILSSYVNIDQSSVKPLDYEMHIMLEKEAPFFYRPRRLSYAEKLAVREIIDDLLKQEIIRPSKSPFASPIVLVKKKDDSRRMCVDYRTNKQTIRDNYPFSVN